METDQSDEATHQMEGNPGVTLVTLAPAFLLVLIWVTTFPGRPNILVIAAMVGLQILVLIWRVIRWLKIIIESAAGVGES
jgi:hypothetical protein